MKDSLIKGSFNKMQSGRLINTSNPLKDLSKRNAGNEAYCSMLSSSNKGYL